MHAKQRGWCEWAATLLFAACTTAGPALASQPAAEQYKGRPLVESLQLLQAKGLKIVFTSATVTPDLRVKLEPRATTPRQQLNELLEPHGLTAREGPGGIIQVIRKNTTPRGPAASKPAGSPSPPGPARHTEHVIVNPVPPNRSDPGASSEVRLQRREFERFYGSLADDPFRVVHAFPRAVGVDEFKSDFSVRGSPFRHASLVVDGVSTPWLQHTAHGRGPTGSLAMFASQVLEGATLRAGAYPRRHSDRLGPELSVSLREGSRARFQLRGIVGGSSASVLAEGPIGKTARGSWLVALRHSYMEWPPEDTEPTRAVFGFSDGLAKAVYDLGEGQRMEFGVLGGISNVDGEDGEPVRLGDGTNRASMANLAWRSTFGAATVLQQRVYLVRQYFLNKTQAGEEASRGINREVVYRADVRQSINRGLIEAGAQVGRSATRQVPDSHGGSAFLGSAWSRSAYLHGRWKPLPTVTLSPGFRLSDSTLLSAPTLARWLLAEWQFRAGWTLSVSADLARQSPDLHQVFGPAGSRQLRPERARHVDLAIDQRLTETIGWQATLFGRIEDDVLREPYTHPRLVKGALTSEAGTPYANALRGRARGVELLLDRRRATGLSGWIAYSYGRTQYTDVGHSETFWAEFDQRHAFNVLATYRLSDRASVSATFRTGSNFPVPGYLAYRDGGLFAGAARNQVRLPAYARLDLRADRSFESSSKRLTVFVEVLNVLNRANASVTSGSVDPLTGAATGFVDSSFRRRASAGLLVQF
jgi:hypothetical protein